MAAGAASQSIRAHVSEGGAGMRMGLKSDQNGGERIRFLDFFEPLAGVLHGARRILIFGRTTPLGDETGPFVFWLCNRYPDLARRIVASLPIEPDEMSESNLLARARAFFKRTDTPAPPTVGSGERVMLDSRRSA